MSIPRRSSVIALACTALLVAQAAHALTVLSPASVAPGAKSLAAQFTAKTGVAVIFGGGARDRIFAALKAGDAADLVLLPSADFAGLSGMTAVTPLVRIPVGAAVKAGAPLPDISTPEKFRAALLAARGVAYADPAAGTSAGKLIDRMLSAPEFAGVKRVPVKGLAVGGIASGAADIALQMLPELAADKTVTLAGPVPASYGATVEFSAAIPATATDTENARILMETLTAPGNAAVWTAQGMLPVH